MRTTIRLEDHLLREAKAHAARAGCSLNEFIEEAVRVALLSGGTDQPTPPPPLPLYRGGRGLRAGVDLDNNAALLELMDDDVS
ncbi:MAG: ribbon-helix-helix domain-containing protein [Gemmatimonas sp.]|nr:ribbon-helix-helix domain-containing protein [Gemmatimonas sp.]